jgi:hypothetical protein
MAGPRKVYAVHTVVYTGIFFERGLRREFFRGGGVQQIQLRTEGRENGGSGGGTPLVRGSTQFAHE